MIGSRAFPSPRSGILPSNLFYINWMVRNWMMTYARGKNCTSYLDWGLFLLQDPRVSTYQKPAPKREKQVHACRCRHYHWVIFPSSKSWKLPKKLWLLRLMPGQRLNHQDQDPAVKLVPTWKPDLCQPAIKHWFLRITVRDWTIKIRILPSNLCQLGNQIISSSPVMSMGS